MLRLYNTKSGFTLLELLISLSIISALLFFAIPNFNQLINRQLVNSKVHAIMQIIDYAKIESITGDLHIYPITEDWSCGVRIEKNGTEIYHRKFKNNGVRVSWHGFYNDKVILFSKQLYKSSANGHFIISKANINKKIILNKLARTKIVSNLGS